MWVIRRLYQFILQQPVSFWLGSLFMVIGLGLTNTAPFFVQWLTESAQAEQFDQALVLTLAFGCVLLASNLISSLAFYIGDKNLVGTSTRLAHAVLTHIHNLDFAYHTHKSSGKLISLMKRGDEAFFTFYDIFNRQILGLGLSFIVMGGAFAQLQLHYVLLVIGLVILTLFVSWGLIKRNIQKRRAFTEKDDDVSAVRVDNLVNFDTVKYFAQEAFEQRRFAQLLREWDEALQNYFFTFRYFDWVVGNLINGVLVGIMAIAVWDLQRGELALPEFVLVTTFALTLLPKLMNFLFNLRDLAKKYPDMQAYFELLEEKIVVQDPLKPQVLPPGPGAVVFDHVTFSYGEATPVLKDFDLTIQPGEAVALVGYSGAGKTTIAKLLMRMYDAQTGEVSINGVPVRAVTKQELRRRIGIVPQDPLLFNNTIYYNIAYAKASAHRAAVLAAADAAKVSDFVAHLSHGYDTIVGERGIKLSGGQRQRLAIARILLEQPEILILDVATSALDSASEQTIQTAFWQLVRDKERPRTAIIIAHRLSTIMQADRIIVMDKGSIVDSGSHVELMSKGTGIYHQLWSLQRNGFIGDGESEEEPHSLD